MRTNWYTRLTLCAAFAGILVLLVPGCSNPSGGGEDGGEDPDYRAMVSLTGGTVTGDTAYYYDISQEWYKGVFIENRTVTLSGFKIAKYETTYELWYEVYRWATDGAARGGNVYTFANAGREGHDGSDGALPVTETEPVTGINWRDAEYYRFVCE